MSLIIYAEPWLTAFDPACLSLPVLLGPIVVSDDPDRPKFNGRKLPLHSQWNEASRVIRTYTFPYVAPALPSASLSLCAGEEDISVKILGALKNPPKRSSQNEPTNDSMPLQVFAFLNSAVSLLDELFLCAEFISGKKTAGSALFKEITEPRKEDFKRGNFEWRPLEWDLVSSVVLRENDEPRYDLIVRVAKEFTEELSMLASNPRKILCRIRKKTMLSRVQQVDAACLAWLVRQPGRSAIEKAGAAQQIYSIVREEYFNTLENRVLKKFINQCIRYSGWYLSENASYSQSDRFATVKRFRSVCQSLMKNPVFKSITELHHIPQPNYVLQFDPVYVKLWNYFLQFVHREKEIDELWIWQRQLWAELMRVFLSTAIYHLSRNNELIANFFINSTACLRKKSFCGSRMLNDSWPRGVRYQLGGQQDVILDCFHPEELHKGNLPETVQQLASKSGGDFFFYFTPVGRPIEEHVLLCIWAIHGPTLAPEDVELAAQTMRASRALCGLKKEFKKLPKLRGLILRSVFGEDKGGDLPKGEVGSVLVEGLRVSWNPSNFQSKGKRFKKELVDLVSQVIAECALSSAGK